MCLYVCGTGNWRVTWRTSRPHPLTTKMHMSSHRQTALETGACPSPDWAVSTWLCVFPTQTNASSIRAYASLMTQYSSNSKVFSSPRRRLNLANKLASYAPHALALTLIGLMRHFPIKITALQKGLRLPRDFHFSQL